MWSFKRSVALTAWIQPALKEVAANMTPAHVAALHAPVDADNPNGKAARQWRKLPYPERHRSKGKLGVIPGSFVADVCGRARELAAADGVNLPPTVTTADVHEYRRLLNYGAPATTTFDAVEDLAQSLSVLAEVQWQTAATPVWVIEDELAQLLALTEPPVENLDASLFTDKLRTPFPGICLLLPNVIQLDTGEGACVPVEALLLGETCILSQAAEKNVPRTEKGAEHAWWQEDAPGRWERAIFVVAVTKPTATIMEGSALGNILHAGVSLNSDYGSNAQLVLRFALNFMLAFAGGYTRSENRKPAKSKRAQFKRSRHERKLRTSYTHVSLTGPRKVHQACTRTATDVRTQRAHWVRGHWHAYWGQDAGECVILESRKREDGVSVFKYLRWLKPYLKGTGEAASPHYRSKE